MRPGHRDAPGPPDRGGRTRGNPWGRGRSRRLPGGLTLPPILVAEGVVSGYNEAPILRGVSARLEPGELVAIIGPNGAGKSTLIKTIFGLLRATEGRVWFEGTEITRMNPERIVARGLSYVPQVENTFPTLTVRENLEMGAFLLNYGVGGRIAHSFQVLSSLIRKVLRFPDAAFWYGRMTTRDYVERRIDTVLQLFPNLRPVLSSRVGKLSGGQQQMVALARALILEPKVLLIDEPSAGLAPKLVDAVFRRIDEIHKAGTAILLVEQNAKKALDMADRAYVLEMGRNRYEGAARDLLNDPQVREMYLGG